MVNVINKSEFDSIINSNEFVVVDFWATWCGPCRMLSSVLDEYSTENPDLVMVKVNVDDAKELASMHDVQSLPTVMLFKNGKELTSKVGFMSKSAFSKFIEENR